MRLRSVIMQAFRDHYFNRGYVEVCNLQFQSVISVASVFFVAQTDVTVQEYGTLHIYICMESEILGL